MPVSNIIAVGDVCLDREDPDSAFALVREELNAADVAFCQIETTYSDRGQPNPAVHVPLRASPSNVPALRRAGFTVASFASNHCMDWGPDACMDTVEHLAGAGLAVFGAGRNIREARRPAIVQSNGNRIGWLAYCSILPKDYWAEAKRPGSAPARAHTHYEQIETEQPGTPARIHTFPYDEDMEAMRADIEALRKSADVVVVSMHWGIHFKEAEIAGYQRQYARRAIDAGADLIVGHHPHILKPVELYRGRAIVYSLCNFCFDLTYTEEQWSSPARVERRLKLNPTWTLDPQYRTYPFPADSRMTAILRITCEDAMLRRVAFQPAYINARGQPRLLSRSDEEFGRVEAYMRKITLDQGLPWNFRTEGDAIVLAGPRDTS